MTLSSGKRRGIHRELHRDGRLVDYDRRHRRRILEIRNRLANGDALDSSHRDDVSQVGPLHIDALQSVERE